MEDVISPTSTRRVPPGGFTGRQAQHVVDAMGGPPTKRASCRSTTPARNMSQQRRNTQPAYDTEDDNQIAPSTRTGKARMQPARRKLPMRREWHPTVWVGLTLLLLCLGWIATTMGASWCVTHLSDPGQFGPMHGSIVTGVFGGSDSQGQPSKLLGWNDKGSIRIIMIHADDPAHSQIITGPNLAMGNFPDPAGAQVQLETGDFDHDGNLDVRVTVLSTEFYLPLQRYAQPYTLYGDGKGNLKPQPQQ